MTLQHYPSLSATASAHAPEPSLILLAEPLMYHGFMNGFRQPAALINLRLLPLSNAQLEHLQQAVHTYLGKFALKAELHTTEDVISCFGQALCAVQKYGHMPIFEAEQFSKDPEKETYHLWVPMLFGYWFQQTMLLMLNLFNRYLQDRPFIYDESLAQQIDSMISTLKTHAPQGTNILNFLKAAFELNIPWAHVAVNTFQFGYGKQARWLDSTFSDQTPHIAANLSANKNAASMLMHKLGFPVPEQRVVNNEMEAVAWAGRLGYPVVIKPIDQHSGKGVYCHLVSEHAVRKAFARAKNHTRTVLLEKHIPGNDYRLLVVRGKLIWAIQRIPAHVIGDGVQTIQALVEQHNQSLRHLVPFRQITITDDTHEYLQEQGVNLAMVLAKGQSVQLSRIANVSAGGTPVGVFDKVHPDNQQLAESVAQLFRLDITGIDFVSPDISQSWRDNGGKIIEANVQPQLGSSTWPGIYRGILSSFVPAQGRIPIIVVQGNSVILQQFITRLQQTLLQRHPKVGVAKDNSAYMNETKLVDTPSLFQAGLHLLLKADLEALIYCVSRDHELQIQGLPFDRFDSLFSLDQTLPETLLRACRGQVITVEPTTNKAVPTRESGPDAEWIEQEALLISLWNSMSLAASA